MKRFPTPAPKARTHDLSTENNHLYQVTDEKVDQQDIIRASKAQSNDPTDEGIPL